MFHIVVIGDFNCIPNEPVACKQQLTALTYLISDPPESYELSHVICRWPRPCVPSASAFDGMVVLVVRIRNNCSPKPETHNVAIKEPETMMHIGQHMPGASGAVEDDACTSG